MKKLSVSLLIVGFVGVVVGAILKIEGKGNLANSIILSSIIISLMVVLLVLVKGRVRLRINTVEKIIMKSKNILIFSVAISIIGFLISLENHALWRVVSFLVAGLQLICFIFLIRNVRNRKKAIHPSLNTGNTMKE